MHRLFRPIALVALATTASALAHPASAQDAARHAAFLPSASQAADLRTPPTSGPQARTGAGQGPTLESSSVAVRHQESAEAPAAATRGRGQPEAMMIVGGAAVLVGILIGGSAGGAIAVGGAVIGLVGLYQYLQ